MKVKTITVEKDLIVIGAGLPGIVAAIEAARSGIKVALINDRGYLGGNSSAEIRVSVNGADRSSDYNFYSREGSLVEEIRLENLYRNWQHTSAPDSSPYWYNRDALLRDMVEREGNLEVYLETHIDNVEIDEKDSIRSVSGTQSGSETRFKFYGDFFLDDTGHGTVGYLAGADFRMGRESKDEFGERIAPDEADDYVIPSTLMWSARDVGKPVEYVAPDFALDITETNILKYRTIPQNNFHRVQWFYELGGDKHQVKNSREIIKDHQALVYGIWDYIKNSGKYDAETYALEYVSCIPGWRESRRLMGEHIIKEQDIVEQKEFEDVVGHGGWSIDLHAIKGFFSKEPINHHIFLKGIYQIPYRSGYSRNIDNLFMAGRCMSTSHVGFGTTRVIATLSTLGQALGAAAALCKEYKETPAEIYKNHLNELQQNLLRSDHFVVGKSNQDKKDKARKAQVASSSVRDFSLTNKVNNIKLEEDMGLILPVKNELGTVSLLLKNEKATELEYEVYTQDKKFSYYPEKFLIKNKVTLNASDNFRWVELSVGQEIDNNKVFIQLLRNKEIDLALTDKKLPGVISIKKNPNQNSRIVDVETLEPREYIWRKLDNSFCFKTNTQEEIYSADNINNGYHRPYGLPNIWVSEESEDNEWVELEFDKIININNIKLYFDSELNTDINYYHENEIRVIPSLVKDYDVYYFNSSEYVEAASIKNNYQRLNNIFLDNVETNKVKIVFKETNGGPTYNLYEIRVY